MGNELTDSCGPGRELRTVANEVGLKTRGVPRGTGWRHVGCHVGSAEFHREPQTPPCVTRSSTTTDVEYFNWRRHVFGEWSQERGGNITSGCAPNNSRDLYLWSKVSKCMSVPVDGTRELQSEDTMRLQRPLLTNRKHLTRGCFTHNCH